MFSKLILFGAAVSALPNSYPLSPQVCKDVNIIVNALHLYPSASSFCSSFIHIPVVTSTSTKVVGTTTAYTATTTTTVSQSAVATTTVATQALTTATVATATSTRFVTAATTTTAVQTVNSTTTTTFQTTAAPVTTTSTQTVTVTSTTYPNFNKRRDIGSESQNHKRGTPANLAKFASTALSKGCSCLNLPTSTVTSTTSVTQTVKAISTATTTTVISRVVTATSTTTQTIPATDTTTVTNTVSSTETDSTTSKNTITNTITQTVTPTSTATSTSTVIATQTATVDPCTPSNAVNYSNGIGSPFHSRGVSEALSGTSSAEACCRSCFAATNCVYAIFDVSQFGNSCFSVGLDTGFDDPSATCPIGVSFDSVATGGSPGLEDDAGHTLVLGPCFQGGRE